jgi:hypothetical protein
MLLEFGSAESARRCRIDVQRAISADNQSKAPDERIEFRNAFPIFIARFREDLQ